MYNCYFGKNRENKMILFLTTLVHLFSHFEFIILALNPRWVFPAKMYSLYLCLIAHNSFFRIKENSLVHPKDYKTSVYILLLSSRSLKASLGLLWLIWGFPLHPTPPLFCPFSQKWAFRSVHMPWTLLGWAWFAALGHHEIFKEDCFWTARVIFIELGSDFLMKNLICVVFATSNATDTIWTHPQTTGCVILAFR